METPLFRAREARSLTKAEVARDAGCSKSFYGRIEAAEIIDGRIVKASPELARRIVGVIGASMITEHQVLFPEDFTPALAAALSTTVSTTAVSSPLPSPAPHNPPENEGTTVKLSQVTLGKCFEGPDGNGGSERLQVIEKIGIGFLVEYTDRRTKEMTGSEIAQWATRQLETFQKHKPEEFRAEELSATV